MESEAVASGYPLTIENYDGYGGNGEIISQTFYAPPQRIVATSEVTIDDLIFLGLENRIVGVSDMTDRSHEPYDEIYQKLYRLNSLGSYPSREQVVAVEPDIIIGWGSLFQNSAIGSVKEWQARGIHTYVMTNTVPTKFTGNRKVEYFLDDLRNLARIFHIEKQTEKSINTLQNRLDQLETWSRNIPEKERPTIVTVQYIYGNEYFARTGMDLTSDIIRLAGGRSLDGLVGSKQSIEFLLKENPDILLVVDTPRVRAVKKIQDMENNPILQNVNAVRNHKFLVIDQNAFYCGSPRTIEAIEQLQKLVRTQMEKNFQ